MRDWLEGQRWYWYTLTIDIHPLPWHWQIEWTNHGWGYRGLFGPVGFMILKPLGKKEEC